MEISATDVKKLRDRTGMPFGKCKEALVATAGDLKAALHHAAHAILFLWLFSPTTSFIR